MNANNTAATFPVKPLLISGEYLPIDWLQEEPPALEFCIDPLAPIGGVTVVNAHGGTGKSLLALKIAIHVALGLDILDAPTQVGKVAYLSLEDSKPVFRQRLYKIVQSMPNEVSTRLEELTSRLFFINRYGKQTFMMGIESGNVVESDYPTDLISLLKEHSIKCLIIDTLVRTHSLNENDNAQMGALLVLFEKIAADSECAVILIHHQSKGGGNGEYAARGASSIIDNARSVLCLEKVAEKKADGFEEENIRIAIKEDRLVRLTHTKHNNSPKHPEQYFEITRDGVPLERFPLVSTNGNLENRYAEMFAWYQKRWGSKPITKTNIDEHYKDMRPKGTTYGKGTYKKSLQLAIEAGYAEKTSPPEGASKNPKADYYVLRSLDEL